MEPSVCTTNHTLFASKRVAYSLCGLKVQPAWETPLNHLYHCQQLMVLASNHERLHFQVFTINL